MPNKSAALEKEMKVRSAKPNKWLRFYRCIPLYLMFLPGALYLLMDKYIPMSGLIIAFKKVNWRKGILASDWVGFSNFTYLFKTKDAFNITRNTLLYNLCFIVLGTRDCHYNRDSLKRDYEQVVQAGVPDHHSDART